MTKKLKTTPKTIKSSDVIGFIAALVYMQSILTVAHHVSSWPHDGSLHIVEPPSLLALAVSLILVFASTYQDKKVSILNIITLTVLATGSIFWLSGLRTNFYL